MSQGIGEDPALACHASHLGRHLPALRPQTIERLRATPRLSGRLTALLAVEMPTGSGLAPDAVERLALASAVAVAEVGVRMGALWHARAISRCIDATTITALEGDIGRPARLFALRHVELSADDVQADGASADLAACVRHDGWRCLARWRDLVAPPYRMLATLLLPLEELPDPADGAIADRLIACAIQAFIDGA